MCHSGRVPVQIEGQTPIQGGNKISLHFNMLGFKCSETLGVTRMPLIDIPVTIRRYM